MRRLRPSLIVAMLACLCAAAGPSKMDRLIHDNRRTLIVRDGDFAGDGAAFLRAAIDGAQFVAIGEQHGTREIPDFATAVCRAMAPRGLDAIAVEAGPVAIGQVAPWTRRADGAALMGKAEAATPDFIAFFNWRPEFDFLGACQAAAGPRVAVWGLDQEFVGAPDLLLREIVARGGHGSLGEIARPVLTACQAATAASIASGAWQDACVFKLPDADWARLRDAAAQSGDADARGLAAALRKTQHIYTAHESGHGYEANRERALLLKQNFLADETRAAGLLGRTPRVLLKFGENHLYRGFDMTNQVDLGNFVTEFADGLGQTSLHIAIIGMRGTNAENAGPGRPSRSVAFQAETSPGSDFAFMKPFFDQADAHAMTVFDMRPFRPVFASLGPVDRETERLIFGYDLVVVSPAVHAAGDIR